MSVRTGLADVGFFLGRTAAVGSCHVFLLLCLGAYFPVRRCAFLLWSSTEGNAVEDDIIYVVACKLAHNSILMGPKSLIGLMS